MYPGKVFEDVLLDELANLLGIDRRDAHLKNKIRILRCFTAQNALSIPTPEQVIRSSKTESFLAKAAPGAALTGNLLGYGVTSLNDQIIQGLKISEEFA
jgi:hypothetical protein